VEFIVPIIHTHVNEGKKYSGIAKYQGLARLKLGVSISISIEILYLEQHTETVILYEHFLNIL
jgi:hypothetical protein